MRCLSQMIGLNWGRDCRTDSDVQKLAEHSLAFACKIFTLEHLTGSQLQEAFLPGPSRPASPLLSSTLRQFEGSTSWRGNHRPGPPFEF